MAYTKIITIHSRLDRCVNYALNGSKTALELAADYALEPAKTEDVLFTDAFNCALGTTHAEMRATKQRWGKEQNKVLGYHIIQSFKPGEVTPEQAHEIGCEFIRRFLAEKYEVVVGTHLDKEHLHNHIVFNSCSFTDGRMFRNNFADYYKGIRAVSDELCQENSLSVINPKGKGKQYKEWRDEKDGKPTMRQMIRVDVDEVLAEAVSWPTFLQGLQRRGYLVKSGPNVKYMAVRHKVGGKFMRLKSLGESYTEEALRQRLAQPQHEESTVLLPQPTKNAVPRRTYHPQQRPRKIYRLRGPFIYTQQRKYRGFIALTYRYLHLLGKVRKKRAPRRVSYALRGELRRFDRYLAQHKFLLEHGLTDSTALAVYKRQKENEIKLLTRRRAVLYRQRDNTANGLNKADLSAKIEEMTAALRAMRKEARMCTSVEDDVQHIQEQLALAYPQPEEKNEPEREAKKHEHER